MTRPDNSQDRGGDQQNNGSFYPFAALNPFDPPDAQTLVYSPDVRILIARGNKEYDVSKDVINGSIVRKENAASTLQFSLANKGDYNGLFHRMDRVTVFLKRIAWQQVFSGYLDTVPFAQLYGGTANYKATCTIKRLLNTWWTPTLAKSQNIFNSRMFADEVGDGQKPADSGLGSILQRLLSLVGGWQPQDVHIQNFPMPFYDFLQAQLAAKRNANQAGADKFRQMLLGKNYNDTAPGAFAGYSNEAGPPGPGGIGEAYYIEQIVAACDALGLNVLATEVASTQQLADAANVGAQARDAAVKDGFTQVGVSATAQNQSAQLSDAAILGVACAMVETGGGLTIRNLGNPTVPESLNYFPDGLGGDHDSIGIFQQRNNGWGLVSQRMDPRQAATMFFRHLPPEWRNLPPGDAIQRVQQNGFPARFAAAIPLATVKVQALRKAKQGATSTIASTPLGAAVTAAGAPVGINPSMVAGAASTSPSPATDIAAALGKPNPDNEGAIQEAISKLGCPYIWGASGPLQFDCSGLIRWCFRAIGKQISGSTWDMAKDLPRVSEADIQRGDILIVNGGAHVVLYLGNGEVIEAAGLGEGTTTPQPGQMVKYTPLLNHLPIKSAHRVGRNGGFNPLSPRLNPMTSGPGSPAGTGDYYGDGANNGQSEEPIAQNLFAYLFNPGQFVSDTAEMFTMDHKNYIDSEPLIHMVQAVAGASLRNFASAPDGSFMAYYPDHFGLDGKKAIVRLEDIELKDVRVNFSDDNLTTHVYVAGDHTFAGLGANINPLAWLETAGSVTVEHEWLFERLRQIAPGDLGGVSGLELMKRFGVRPLKVPVAMAGSEHLEFLLACHYFMEKWAAQYETAASFTFLPELFPGMRVILSSHNLQVYVSEVTHTFDWENGFSTQAVIMAPSRADPATAMAGISGALGGPDDTNILRGLGGFDSTGTSTGASVP
jgi:cell wall-associated NlpC family hydrolase